MTTTRSRRRHGICVFAAGTMVLAATLFAGAQSRVPKYEVDASWPKPFPEGWIVGTIGGVCTGNDDHVLVLRRQEIVEGDLNAGSLAPPIIELDGDGNVVRAWGDGNLLDPRLHSCFVDKDGNIWVASAPSGMVQKYSADGSKLLFQIGKKGALDSSDGTAKGTPLKIRTRRASSCRRASTSIRGTATSTSPTAKAVAVSAASR
jgi:hypothetical protein